MSSSRAAGVLRRIRTGDDSGSALVLVVGSMMILAMLLLTALGYAVASTKFSRYDQDYSAAMTAAQSGVEDFISHLNRDDTYPQAVDCTNPALQNPTDCGVDYGWLPVTPGVTDPGAPHFHYSVDASGQFTNGAIMVVSTGRSRDVYRTIEVAVGKGGSNHYVYYTDFESADPENAVAYPGGTTRVQCGANGSGSASYYWEGRTGCTEIQFAPNDLLRGPVFSNDAIWSVGGRFLSTVESAYPNCQNVDVATPSTWNRCLRGGSAFAATGTSATFQEAPQDSGILMLPDSSAVFASYPGCHFYGATRIVFNGATMTVWSKDSNFTGAVLSVVAPGGTAPSCGTGTQLASASGATVPVPNDMVVYVAGAPTTGAGAVSRRQLYAGEIGGPAGQLLPLGTYDASIPDTASNGAPSYRADSNMLNATKYRGEGNLYVQGVVDGRVTLSTAQSIVVTGDVVLTDGPNGNDMVGMVATNSVEIMHPWLVTVVASLSGGSAWSWRTTGGSQDNTWPVRVIDPVQGTETPSNGVQVAAGIQTLQHSMFVQDYNRGNDQGVLLIVGSIAQRWRGAVGTTADTGYDKDYRYDARLRYTAPPYFPHWVNAQWAMTYSGEVHTADELKSP